MHDVDWSAEFFRQMDEQINRINLGCVWAGSEKGRILAPVRARFVQLFRRRIDRAGQLGMGQ